MTLIPKPDKDTHTHTHTHTQIVDVSLRNRGAKILNKILTNQIQQYTQRIIQHAQVGFIPGMKGWCNMKHLIKKMEKKNHMIIPVDAEKEFGKSQYPFMIKKILSTKLA